MSIRLIIPSLALLIASGTLAAQEGGYQAKPDPSLKFHYKRFFRGENEKIADEAWGRHQWWLERMGGELGPDFYQHFIREAEKERTRYPELFVRPGVDMPVAITPAAWTNIGPTSADFASNGITLNIVDSGRGRAILPHPTNPDIVYFLNSGGGLWKTTNFTSSNTTWTPTTDFVGSTAGGSAAFGRTPSVIYVGTGEPFDGGVGGFVVKSTNEAASWSNAVFLSGATKVCDLKVDTSGGQDIVLVGTDVGLFRSSDAGNSFTSVGGANLAGKQVWSIVQTSIGWLASAQDPATGEGFLFISTNLGADWNPITNAGGVFSGAGRSTLAVGAPGDSTVYCFSADKGDAKQLDLFKSTDGGQTWAALGITNKTPVNPNSDQPDMDILAGQAFFNHMIVVDPTDSTRNTVILGGQLATARTTNGGTTWTLLTDWLPDGVDITLPYSHADNHAAAISNIGGTKRIFFGNDGGLSWSADNGATFDDKKNNGLASHLIYALAVNPKVVGSALIGLQDNGTRSRVLNPTPSTTYNQVKGGDGFGVGWAPGSGASLCSYVYNKISKSTTNPPVSQSNWAPFTTGLPAGTGSSSTNYYFVTPIIAPTEQADPTGTVFFTYGKKGIYKSNATGWTTIGTPGTGGISAGRVVRGVSHGLGIHPYNLNLIAAAGSNGAVMITTNGGTSWTETVIGTDTGVPNWGLNNANVVWATDQILFACSEGTAAGVARVAKSTNGGATWSRSDTGLPDVPVTKIVMDEGDGTHKTAYAATWLGVYRTTDGGATWSRFGTGLPQGRVTDIYVAPDSSFIRISTWGRGVWEMVNVPAAGTVNISPTSALVYSGSTVAFSGTVNGGGTVNYTTTGGSITGAGLFTAGSTPGTYTVTATNAANSAQSAIATVTVAQMVMPVFTTQPTSLTRIAGLRADFTGTATATPAATYQWQSSPTGSAWTNINGATSNTYKFYPAATDANKQFRVVATNLGGSVPSNAAILTLTPNLVQKLVNPDFEMSPFGSGWIWSHTASTMQDSTNVHEGSNSAVFGYWQAITTDWIYQDVTIPANPTSADLSFWMKILNGNGVPTSVVNTMTVKVKNTSGGDLATLGTFNNTTTGFSSHAKVGPYNLKPYAGQTIRIYLTSDQTNASYNTAFFVDDVNLIVNTVTTGPSFNINGDGATDAYDLLELLKRFGSTTAEDLAKADFNSDGQINDADLTALLGAL